MSEQTIYIRGSQGVGKDTLARFLSILNLECRVRVIKAGESAKRERTIQATGFYEGEENYQVMQVIVCDPHGRFPEDPACEEPYRGIKIYSPRLDHN